MSHKRASPQIGNAGATQQLAVTGEAVLTTNFGLALSDHQNSLRAGDHGPTALEDFNLREKIFHIGHERFPQRIVHARGDGFFDIIAACSPAV